jgi:topoisomerase IV subunit B
LRAALPAIHLKGEDIEIAFTHGEQYGEEYYSFVNGQHTTQGGTHLAAFREAVVKTVRDFTKKFRPPTSALPSSPPSRKGRGTRLRIADQNQARAPRTIGPDGPTLRTFIGNFVKPRTRQLPPQNPEVAKALQKRILQSERERKELAGIKKLARERAQKGQDPQQETARLPHPLRLQDKRAWPPRSSSPRATRPAAPSPRPATSKTQAVFSLRGKPLNCFGLTKKVVYENEEFNLLQARPQHRGRASKTCATTAWSSPPTPMSTACTSACCCSLFSSSSSPTLIRVRDKNQTFYCYSDISTSSKIRTSGYPPSDVRNKRQDFRQPPPGKRPGRGLATAVLSIYSQLIWSEKGYFLKFICQKGAQTAIYFRWHNTCPTPGYFVNKVSFCYFIFLLAGAPAKRNIKTDCAGAARTISLYKLSILNH